MSTVTRCMHGAGAGSDVMFPEAERVLIWTKEGMEGVSIANETGRTVMHAGYGCNAAGWPDEPKTIGAATPLPFSPFRHSYRALEGTAASCLRCRRLAITALAARALAPSHSAVPIQC